MTFNRWRCSPRLLWTLLVLLGLASCARSAKPETYVVSGQAAAHAARMQPCVHQHDPRPDRIHLDLPAPAGGWSGAPQAVVVMNVFRGQVRIRHGSRERCGMPQDARTLDSRFLAGMGTVLMPPRGDLQPIQVAFDASPFPLWRPIVRFGEPTPVQREDTLRFALRVASIAVMLALLLSSLLTFVSTRERTFLSYTATTALFALWMALLSGLWAYPRPWLPEGEWVLKLMIALPAVMIGLTMRMLAHQSAPAALSARVRSASHWLLLGTLALAVMIMTLPQSALALTSLLDEIGIYLLSLVLACLAALTIWHGERGGITALSCVAPFLVLGFMELVIPGALAAWKVEAMMLSGSWLALAGSMALTLRLGTLRRQRDEMRILARTDPLTGLPNRRAALEHLALASAQARRSGHSVAVGFLDIDHFKHINDQHGHDVGDQVLQLFAQTLGQVFRDADYVARMGGEEFLVILPGASPQDARSRIESLHALLGPIATKLQLHGLRVTLSGGVTGLLAEDTDVLPVLQRADAAMYAAKRGGRDRVELAEGPWKAKGLV